MNYFTPVFSSIVDSSLWMEEDYVTKAFITMLALKDWRHIVETNAFRLGRRCWPLLPPQESESKALKALEILSSPDTKRLEPQEFEGRRIKKVEDGYLILNGQHYEDMMRSVSRKVYKARKEREYRANKGRKRGRPISGERRAVVAENNGNHELAEAIAAGEA